MPKCPNCGEEDPDKLEKVAVRKQNEESELERKMGYDCQTCGECDWREEFEVDDWVEVTLRFKRTDHGSEQKRVDTDSSEEVSEELLQLIHEDWGFNLGVDDVPGRVVEK